MLQVLPGSRIPSDGEVVEGSAYVDEAMLTGESMPVHKHVGDAVMGGTVNGLGVFVIKATRVGADSTLHQVSAFALFQQ